MDLKTGYPIKNAGIPVKRYCQTLQLKNDPELIAEYKLWHGRERRWPEIPRGIKAAGILEMEIYIHGNTLFMIVETPLDFDWDLAFGKLAKMERQQEWETFVSRFQQTDPDSSSSEKWTLMERIFNL